MTDFKQKEAYDIADLLEIMRILRAPGGCPWDRQQDHHSIRRNFIEETYEVVEAIDENDTAHLQEELGDVLLQVVFHAQMEQEAGSFDIHDVADGVCKKLIYRHPHIFGEVKADTAEQVLTNWDALKRIEKGQQTTTDAMRSVARSLPQLIRAEKVQAKAAKAGFDWDSVDGALDKTQEELAELRQAITEQSNMAEELGDLLFAVVNIARFVKIDPENALEKATDKFLARFARVEDSVISSGGQMKAMSMQELDALWENAKAQLCKQMEEENH